MGLMTGTEPSPLLCILGGLNLEVQSIRTGADNCKQEQAMGEGNDGRRERLSKRSKLESSSAVLQVAGA